MNQVNLKFGLITALAVALAGYTGITLKTRAADLENWQLIAWGLVFTAACITAVRGFRYLARK